MRLNFEPILSENQQNIRNSLIIHQLVKNVLKLFNKTPKYEKYAVLSIVADLISKKELRKNGFVFSDTMFRTSKK